MEEKVIDFSRIQATSQGDVAFEEALYEAYLKDCAKRLGDLRLAVDGGDLERAKRCAHAIKGASLNVGTTRLHEYAESIETGEAIQDGEISPQTLGALFEAFNQVKSAIETHMGE